MYAQVAGPGLCPRGQRLGGKCVPNDGGFVGINAHRPSLKSERTAATLGQTGPLPKASTDQMATIYIVCILKKVEGVMLQVVGWETEYGIWAGVGRLLHVRCLVS